MPKVELWDDGSVYFFCPGCGEGHRATTKAIDNGLGGLTPAWQFNGDVNKPTITPSIRVSMDFKDHVPQRICHSQVTDGRIHFYKDSTHQFAGKTLDLPEME